MECSLAALRDEAGGVVTARVEVRADEIRQVGIERIVLWYTVQVVVPQVVAPAAQADLGDDQTLRYSAMGVGRASAEPALPAPATPYG